MSEMKIIPGFGGLYATTADGRVWSFPRKWIGMRGQTFSHDGKWLKTPLSLGYPVARLTDSAGKQRTMLVHRLVALSWLPNPHGLPEVNHINGDPADPRAENLEWCTRSHNVRHAYRNGLIAIDDAWRSRTAAMGLSTRRLSMTDAETIRALVAAGSRQYQVAEQYGLSRAAINNIINHKTYRS
ncbi:HNH endonuclease [Bordetella genomosp. 12]|uniref:HNH nuclease domain-containing protein n=1 Tax=Bordetella genomosp. 12 TaxID=463035 RepID=A0A261VLC3_9BORD|nr:HNH endonuclease [Bordetella genomosp. 12]OZI74551.1 hypothetical protein CAL22_08815 [Bordetella genomosp. 12]